MKLLILVSIFFPFTITLLTFSLLTLQGNTYKYSEVHAREMQEKKNGAVAAIETPDSTVPNQDIRVFALLGFLSEYQSPLADYTEDLVKQADLHGLDYALIPAIAMQESGLCKTIPENSHNCWGLGIYGSKVTRFPSYTAAIQKVAKTLKESYIKKGLTNATLVEDAWTPSSDGLWSYSVNSYIGKIHQYEKDAPNT